MKKKIKKSITIIVGVTFEVAHNEEKDVALGDGADHNLTLLVHDDQTVELLVDDFIADLVEILVDVHGDQVVVLV